MKLINVYENHEVNFGATGDVFNIVLPNHEAEEFLAHDNVGQILYQQFKSERLQGDKSIWDPLKKRKISTFATTRKSFKTKIDSKTVQIKEEKKSMTKFIIALRSREDMSLQ